jgi:hypothetical protein
MDTMRNAANEAADPLTDHVNNLIRSKQTFHRGFYSSMRGQPHHLPIPFPRFFTPFALTENGEIKEQFSQEDRERLKQKDEFVVTVPSLVKLAQDGSYLSRAEDAYN